jgi:hypothetical protein
MTSTAPLDLNRSIAFQRFKYCELLRNGRLLYPSVFEGHPFCEAPLVLFGKVGRKNMRGGGDFHGGGMMSLLTRGDCWGGGGQQSNPLTVCFECIRSISF